MLNYSNTLFPLVNFDILESTSFKTLFERDTFVDFSSYLNKKLFYLKEII